MTKLKVNRSGWAQSRRRTRLPIVPLVALAVLIGLLVLLWTRGGEQPQQRVEKPIAADRLGK